MSGSEFKNGPSDTDALLASTLLTIRSRRTATVDGREQATAEKAPSPPSSKNASPLNQRTTTDQSRQGQFDPVASYLSAAFGVAQGVPPTSSFASQVASPGSNPLFSARLAAHAASPNSNILIASRPDRTVSSLLAPNFGVHTPSAGGRHYTSQPAARQKSASSSSSSAAAAAAAAAIRKEQVEAALRSKPQRGRKRDNLSEAERLELTRTRNREHAKSTRNRKKARYQELVDKEAQLKAILDKQKLDRERRETVVELLAKRERMVRGLESSSGSDGNFSDHGDPGQDDVDSNLEVFSFEYEHAGAAQGTSVVEGMKRFDTWIANRTTEQFGADAVALLAYAASPNEIALNLADTAHLEVDVELNCPPTLKLISAHVIVKFARGSKSIKAVKWRTLKDSFDDVSSDRLRLQISHPSVVSLDPALSLDGIASCKKSEEGDEVAENKQEESEAGPGMAI